MEKVRVYVAQPKKEKVYDKITNLLSWFITESGTISVWLQHGASENFRLTDINGRVIEQGDLKEGRVIFTRMPKGTYILHVATAKGTITKEIDIQ